MADDKKSDETAKAEDSKAEDKVVEVEVVETETSDDKTSDESAETHSDEPASVVDEPDAPPAPATDRSPGLILFGFFVAAALAIFALFRFTGGDKPAETAPAEVASADESAVAAIGAEPAEETTSAATETTTTSGTPSTNDNQQSPTVDAASEDAADLFAADPSGDVAEEESTVETEPVDPRAAIAALQREAEQQADAAPDDATANIDAPEAEETALSPEEATAIAAEEAAVAAEETVSDELAVDETDAADSAEETEVATAEPTDDVETPAEDAATETEEEGLATQGRAQLAQKDFSNFSAAVPEDTGKIANELESLKETLRQETDALSAAVSEGRELTEQQSTRITELRQSLEQALAERDERANTEIAELRSRLDKIQSGSAQIPAGRQAAASLALLSLQRAVNEGEPYTEELNVLERLTPNASILDNLRANASTGAPTLAALKAQFEPAVRDALAASDSGQAKGFFGRIQKLVSVRPATPQAGERPAQVISRAEYHLEKDDIASTVNELDALTGGAAEAFAEWRANAQKRLDATTAIEELNSALLSEVGQ